MDLKLPAQTVAPKHRSSIKVNANIDTRNVRKVSDQSVVATLFGATTEFKMSPDLSAVDDPSNSNIDGELSGLHSTMEKENGSPTISPGQTAKLNLIPIQVEQVDKTKSRSRSRDHSRNQSRNISPPASVNKGRTITNLNNSVVLESNAKHFKVNMNESPSALNSVRHKQQQKTKANQILVINDDPTDRERTKRRGDTTANIFQSDLGTTVMGSDEAKAQQADRVSGGGQPGKHFLELKKLSKQSRAASSQLMHGSQDNASSPGNEDPLKIMQSNITMAEMKAVSLTASQDSNPDPLKAPEMIRFLKDSHTILSGKHNQSKMSATVQVVNPNELFARRKVRQQMPRFKNAAQTSSISRTRGHRHTSVNRAEQAAATRDMMMTFAANNPALNTVAHSRLGSLDLAPQPMLIQPIKPITAGNLVRMNVQNCRRLANMSYNQQQRRFTNFSVFDTSRQSKNNNKVQDYFGDVRLEASLSPGTTVHGENVMSQSPAGSEELTCLQLGDQMSSFLKNQHLAVPFKAHADFAHHSPMRDSQNYVLMENPLNTQTMFEKNETLESANMRQAKSVYHSKEGDIKTGGQSSLMTRAQAHAQQLKAFKKQNYKELIGTTLQASPTSQQADEMNMQLRQALPSFTFGRATPTGMTVETSAPTHLLTPQTAQQLKQQAQNDLRDNSAIQPKENCSVSQEQTLAANSVTPKDSMRTPAASVVIADRVGAANRRYDMQKIGRQGTMRLNDGQRIMLSGEDEATDFVIKQFERFQSVFQQQQVQYLQNRQKLIEVIHSRRQRGNNSNPPMQQNQRPAQVPVLTDLKKVNQMSQEENQKAFERKMDGMLSGAQLDASKEQQQRGDEQPHMSFESFRAYVGSKFSQDPQKMEAAKEALSAAQDILNGQPQQFIILKERLRQIKENIIQAQAAALGYESPQSQLDIQGNPSLSQHDSTTHIMRPAIENGKSKTRKTTQASVCMSRTSQHGVASGGVMSDSDGAETYHLVLLNNSQNEKNKSFIPNFNDSKDLLPSVHQKNTNKKRAETTGNAGTRLASRLQRLHANLVKNSPSAEASLLARSQQREVRSRQAQRKKHETYQQIKIPSLDLGKQVVQTQLRQRRMMQENKSRNNKIIKTNPASMEKQQPRSKVVEMKIQIPTSTRFSKNMVAIQDHAHRAASQHLQQRIKRDSFNNSPQRDGNRVSTAGHPALISARRQSNEVVLIQHLLRDRCPSPPGQDQGTTYSNNDDSLLDSKAQPGTGNQTQRRERRQSLEGDRYVDEGALSTIRHTSGAEARPSPSLLNATRTSHRPRESLHARTNDTSKRTIQFHVQATQMPMSQKRHDNTKMSSKRASTEHTARRQREQRAPHDKQVATEQTLEYSQQPYHYGEMQESFKDPNSTLKKEQVLDGTHQYNIEMRRVLHQSQDETVKTINLETLRLQQQQQSILPMRLNLPNRIYEDGLRRIGTESLDQSSPIGHGMRRTRNGPAIVLHPGTQHGDESIQLQAVDESGRHQDSINIAQLRSSIDETQRDYIWTEKKNANAEGSARSKMGLSERRARGTNEDLANVDIQTKIRSHRRANGQIIPAHRPGSGGRAGVKGRESRVSSIKEIYPNGSMVFKSKHGVDMPIEKTDSRETHEIDLLAGDPLEETSADRARQQQGSPDFTDQMRTGDTGINFDFPQRLGRDQSNENMQNHAFIAQRQSRGQHGPIDERRIASREGSRHKHHTVQPNSRTAVNKDLVSVSAAGPKSQLSRQGSKAANKDHGKGRAVSQQSYKRARRIRVFVGQKPSASNSPQERSFDFTHKNASIGSNLAHDNPGLMLDMQESNQSSAKLNELAEVELMPCLQIMPLGTATATPRQKTHVALKQQFCNFQLPPNSPLTQHLEQQKKDSMRKKQGASKKGGFFQFGNMLSMPAEMQKNSKSPTPPQQHMLNQGNGPFMPARGPTMNTSAMQGFGSIDVHEMERRRRRYLQAKIIEEQRLQLIERNAINLTLQR